MFKAIPILLGGLLLLCCAGCASGPALADSDDILIRYLAVSQRPEVPSREFLLINANHARFDSIYNGNKSRASVKKVPDEMFRVLLALLEDHGFFAMAELGRFPDAESVQIIMVETAQQSWFLSPNPSFTVEDRRKFQEMTMDILDCHNAIPDLQVIDNPEGKNIFLNRNSSQKKENGTRQMK